MLIFNSYWFLSAVAIGGTLFVLAFMYYAVQFFESLEGETIKKFDFGTLNAPEDVKILENPSIKVQDSPPRHRTTLKLTLTGIWLDSHTMLCSRYGTIPRLCKPRYTRRHRSDNREGPSRPGSVGVYNIQTTQTGTSVHASIHNG